jgi:hypothetical protein
MGSRVYAGRSATTRKERVVYSCTCGERFPAEVYRAVDVSHVEEVRRLADGSLNRVRCPQCGAVADVQVPVVYHDTGHDGRAPRLILVLPEGLRHRELAERAALLAALAEDAAPPPPYVLAPEVVFGPAGLRAAVAAAATAPSRTPAVAAPPVAAAAAPATVDHDKTAVTDMTGVDRNHPSLALLPSLVEEETPLPQPKAWLRAVEERRQHDSDQHTRMHMAVPDPRSAVTERWIAGREGPAAFLVEDRVLLCASLPPAALEAFVPGHVELRAQLHRLPSYPLMSLTLVALDPPGGATRPRPEDARLLAVPLDVARAAHRVVLEALGRRCQFSLDLYDSQYLRVVAHEVQAPLEENVRRLVGEAKDALERLAPATRSFERARSQFQSPGYDRLGRTPIDLPEPNDPLDRPGLVRAALSSVARWSEASAEAYLVEIRSMPLPEWRQQRARVVRRALDTGIAVPRPLVERSAKEHGAPLPSWDELLELQIKRFTEVAARLKPNDLSATEEADNWELLLRECSLAGVVVDDQVRKLAQSSLKRARAGAGGGGVDLRTLATAELVALLDQKDLRHEAAINLCERRETPTLPALFNTVRRMTRHEANVVLPAVTRFGHSAEKWLIEGLKSKKSYLRQGCALALGNVGTALAIDALVKLLVSEPTEIWTEVARALGDAGAVVALPVSAMVRDVDVDVRERLVEALAHVAARGGTTGKTAVEQLAAGRDVLVAGAATQALARAPEVRAADIAVRRGHSDGDNVVEHQFSRRFYEVLGGEASGPVELSPDDVEEIDEEIDEEQVAVSTSAVAGPNLAAFDRDGDSTHPTPKTSLPRGRG